MQEWIDRWCNAQLSRGLSPNTEKRRRSSVERFAATTDLATATHVHVESWIAGLRVSPQSRGHYLGDLRAFYKWAIRQDLLEVDPTVKVDAPKKKHYTPNPIPTKQLQSAAMNAPPSRQRLMLTLAGYAGLRCHEIAGLVYEDIDREDMLIRVRGKGDKVRIVPLHPFIEEQLLPHGRGPVVAWRGKAVTPGTVSRNLARYLRGRGINATGHQGRHSFGSRTYAESKDLVAVQEVMGHASPQTTRGYVAFSPDVARRAINALD